MSVLERLPDVEPGEPVGSWMPARYTPSLTGTEDFRTEGDKAIRFAERHVRVPELGKVPVKFYDWQRWLARHVLERYPDDWPVTHLRGQLRFRSVVISMGRQNGKSLLAVLFVLYFIVKHMAGPRVIGLASIDRQAKIVYNRVKYAIDNDDALLRELAATKTRGIRRRDGTGEYLTLPADEDAAQGEPATGVLYDELHLGLAALWDAMLLAMRAKRNALMVGITTAGDDSSQLLIRLYAEGDVAIAGGDERMGFFVWEAESDELTVEGVIAANPTVACGAIPLETVWADAAKMWHDLRKGPDGLTGRQRVVRYTLNRFIKGAADAWVSTDAWGNGDVGEDLEHTGEGRLVFGVERCPDWEAVAITLTTRDGDVYRTQLLATVNDPDPAKLEAALTKLGHRYGHRAVFALSARYLGKLAENLKALGFETWRLGADETAAAAATSAGLIARQVVQHAGDPLVRIQMSRGRRRTTGDTWRLSWSLSTGEIDTVAATTYGLYVAATREQDDGINLW